jgi:predicted metal-binding membrane protein
MQHHLVKAGRLRLPQGFSLMAIVAGSWAVLVVFTWVGDGAIVRHDRLLQGGPPLWIATLMFLVGWQVMLWAMMVAPALDAVQQRRSTPGRAWFLLSYLALWTCFGLCAFFCDLGVHAAVNHSPWLRLHPWLIAGGLLVFAGTYQLSRLKTSSLTACRMFIRGAPAGPIRNRTDDLRAGLAYGMRCLGANWALMLLMFAVGASTAVAMAVATALMLLETTDQRLLNATRVAGYGLIAAGAIVLAGPVLEPLWIA